MSQTYYMFLGRGDYVLSSTPVDRIDPSWRNPGDISPDPADWSYTWDLNTWRSRVDFLKELGADSLIIVINAFELPYPSEAYPSLVEKDHANVRGEFFQDLIDYTKASGLDMIAGLSTTGHCDGALLAMPELGGIHEDGKRWQCAMCHNNPGTIEYARTVVSEVLSRYKGFTGVFLHPPEVAEFCHCDYCKRRFQADTGADLLAATQSEAMQWFWRTGLDAFRGMYDLALEFDQSFSMHMCTIPPVWRQHFRSVAQCIPKDISLIHWDYGRFDEEAKTRIRSDLELYGSAGHKLSFATSATFATSDMSVDELTDHTSRKINFVRSMGVEDVVYFVGPVWFPERIAAATIR